MNITMQERRMHATAYIDRRWGLITGLAALAVGIAVMLFYTLSYQYHFFWWEQNQIFLHVHHWYASYLHHPAWLACLCGEWLSQFFYYLYAGPAILAVCLALWVVGLGAALRRVLGGAPAVCCAVASAVVIFYCTMDASFRLSMLLCVLGGVGLHLALRWCRGWQVLLVPFAYWMLGYGSAIMALLAVADVARRGWRWALLTAFSSLVLFLATPAVCCGYFELKYKQAILYPGIVGPKAPERVFEQTLAVENEYYFGNFDRACYLALSADAPNAVTAFYYYLSQAQRDSLPEHLLSYPIADLGTLNTISADTPLPLTNMMNDLYFALGDMMYAERAAMMRNVFSPQNRNVRMVKRLAEINLQSGDTAAAAKYLGILERTMAYATWARAHRPDAMDNRVRRDLEARRALNNTRDTMRLGDNCRTILIELLESNPENTVALDYLLCTSLLLKDMESFKTDYDRYCMLPGKPRQRSLYQQALMIYLAGTDADSDQWERYISDRSIFERFRAYNGRRRDPAFADTYWYFFDTTTVTPSSR